MLQSTSPKTHNETLSFKRPKLKSEGFKESIKPIFINFNAPSKASKHEMEIGLHHLAKRSSLTTFDEKFPLHQKQSKYLLLGNLNHLLGAQCDPFKCKNSTTCLILSKVAELFIRVWSQTIRTWESDTRRLFSQLKPQTCSESSVLDFLRTLEKQSSFENIFKSEQIRDFLVDPVGFIEQFKFLTLTWPERLVSLFILVRKNCLISLPSCFCSHKLLSVVKRKSSKRKNELMRPFIKKYIELITDLILPRYFLLLSKAERKKEFNRRLEEHCESKNLLKMHFNEFRGKKKDGRQFRTKSLNKLIILLKQNPATSNFFTRDSIISNSGNLKEYILPERNIKIEKFLIQFNTLSLSETFKRLLTQLRNKKVKLFMNRQDVDAFFETAIEAVGFNLINR